MIKNFFAALVAAIATFGALPVNAADFNLPSKVMRKLEVHSQDSGGTLIFSDSPEYVRRNGILYTDTVSGEVRVLFYHLNDTGVRKRFAIVFENVSGSDNVIDVIRAGFSAPNENYFSVGKNTQTMYMENIFRDRIELGTYERCAYQPYEKYFLLYPGQLIYGVCDLKIRGDVRIFLLMYPEDETALNYLSIAPILPKDAHRLRGTFKQMNRTLTLKKPYDGKRDGLGYVMIGDNVNDTFKRGIDATDGSEVVNYGNYGINYTLNFGTKFPTRFFLSPLGGRYAGAMRYHYGDTSGVIQTPNYRLYFGDVTPPESPDIARTREQGTSQLTDYTELTELGTYRGQVSFEYSPPGASNLPVNIVLVPSN